MSTTTVLLLIGNIAVRALRSEARVPSVSSSAEAIMSDVPAPAPAPAIVLPPAPRMYWADIETTNYPVYVSNLRAVGFPEELIRPMIKADVDALYSAREAALKPHPVPHDASTGERYKFPTAEAMEKVRQLMEVAYEKQALLDNLLGTSVPRELIQAPGARNYGAYEYALSQLPYEKREAVQCIEEELFYTDDLNRVLYPNKLQELEAFKQCRKTRDDKLQQILTPEEWERHHMLTTPCGTELARETIGMEPSEDEFRAMFNLAYQRWLDCGGVYGRSRAVPVPPAQIAQVWLNYEEDLRSTLGPDRYLDYQMATSEVGRKLRNFGDRYGLQRGTLGEVFRLQQQWDAVARGARADPGRQAEIQTHLQNLLGPSVWMAWMEGKNSRVQLDP